MRLVKFVMSLLEWTGAFLVGLAAGILLLVGGILALLNVLAALIWLPAIAGIVCLLIYWLLKNL